MKALFIIIPLLLLAGFAGLAYWLFYTCKETKYKHVDQEFIDFRTGDKQTRQVEKPYYTPNIYKVIFGSISSLIAFISLLVLIIVPGSIHQVEAGQVAVVKVWGDAKEVRTAGIHYDLWISHKYEYYDTKVQQVTVKTPAYSNDGQTMEVELVIQYQIQAEKAMEIAKKYGGLEMLESRIETISIERMKSVVSQKSAMAIIETRGAVSLDVTNNISDAITDDYYINVSNVVLTNIDFSDEFEKTVEDKMIAEQEKLKAEYEKEKAIVEAEAQLEKAKKEAEAVIARAEAESQSTELKAQAEANALKAVEEAWNGMSEDVKQAVLQKLAIEQWNGELPNTLVGTEFLQWLLGNIGE